MNKQQLLMTRLRGKGGKKTKKRDLEPGRWRNSSPINLFGIVRGANLEEKVVLGFNLLNFIPEDSIEEKNGQYIVKN